MDLRPQKINSLPPSIPAPAKPTRPRRRSSLPAVPTDVHPKSKKRSPNQVRNPTASPEVISSLIDSLSAISASTHNHFENLLVGYGDSVSLPSSPLAQNFGRKGGYMDVGAQQTLSPNRLPVEIDDACEPPVVRTSKPPSGLSPITAPKREKKDKDNTLKSYMSRGGESAVSVTSAHSLRSVSSIGNISIEPGIARRPSDSSRTSAESKRSLKTHRSLMYVPSRERLRLNEAERRRSIAAPETVSHFDIPRKPVPQLLVAEDTINEEPVIAESSRAAERRPSRGTSPLRNGFNLLQNGESGTPTEKGIIPERASSLRHSSSPSRKSSKRGDGRKSGRHDSSKTKTVPEEDENVDQEVTAKDEIMKELEAEENEVARRIQELKKQKTMRERIAGKLSVGVDAGAAIRSARVSPDATTPYTPTSSVSSLSERAQDPAKAHKVLGITMEQHVPVQGHRHTRTRSSTMNDTEDLTPLPINYRLALQSLDQLDDITQPSSSDGSVSTSGVRSSSTPPLPRRAHSMSLRGRHSLSRQSTSSTIMGPISLHKQPPSGLPSRASSESSGSVQRPIRSASEEITGRHKSMSIAPSISGSTRTQQHTQRPAGKKKRWSHPDIPMKIEKKHNAKVDAHNAAKGYPVEAAPVRSPPHAVIEERPTSVDSIDMGVEGYLNSPRLTQRICHPQTGRVIAFSEVGDPQGFAVFVCVGMGLTRFVMAFYDQLALTLKLRLITPDRPGIGGSQVDPNGTPLSWPDDVLVICQALKITKFSLLAHSAGAVYALATSLRMPQHIRGRVHLLAPWIPPSQMATIGINHDQAPTQQLPRSQRFLRALPPSLLKVANSTLLGASLQRTGPKTAPKTRRKVTNPQIITTPASDAEATRPQLSNHRRESMLLMDQVLPSASSISLALANPADPNYESAKQMNDALSSAERQRQQDFDERLTFAIWDRATAGANPATDLIVCLETKQTIGFRYEDINRPVVIHHGSKDNRVPVDNVRWLGRVMRKCEVRILDGEPHGLMASALVMGNVLTEMASDWEDWTNVVQGKAQDERHLSRKRTAERLRNITSRHGET